jgi:hypothetical protein
LPALTISELQHQIAEYAKARRERDLPLGALLALSILMVVAALVGLSTISGVPRGAWFAAVNVGMALLACTGLYVIATTRRFHQTHAPRCPHCDEALPHLIHLTLILEWLRDLEQRVKERRDLFELTASTSEKLSDAARLRCPRCKGIIAAPAV